MRNPSWSRDELIVALQFYLAHAPSIPGKGSHEILELSQFLYRLRVKLGGTVPEKFRNENGVHMTLMTFRRYDPAYKGKGLQNGNKDLGVVWNRFASDRDGLQRVSDAIRDIVISDVALPSVEVISEDNEEGEEGKVLTRLHRYRERNTSIVRLKKKQTIKEHKSLTCEVCQFDFAEVYGERGHGFIECHHTKPLSELSQQGETTKLSDLSLVCSNCHRMIHKNRPWLSVAHLQVLGQKRHRISNVVIF